LHAQAEAFAARARSIKREIGCNVLALRALQLKRQHSTALIAGFGLSLLGGFFRNKTGGTISADMATGIVIVVD
jgi:hypothetical protein